MSTSPPAGTYGLAVLCYGEGSYKFDNSVDASRRQFQGTCSARGELMQDMFHVPPGARRHELAISHIGLGKAKVEYRIVRE